MKVLFIYPNVWRKHWVLPFGLAYAAAVVKEAGHEIAVLDCTEQTWSDLEVVARARRLGPQLIYFQNKYIDHPRTCALAALLKKECPDVKIFFGGNIFSTNCHILDYNHLGDMRGFDYISVSEAEAALPQLLAYLAAGSSPTGIGGLWVRTGDSWHKDMEMQMADVASLPSPYLAEFDRRHLTAPLAGTPVLTKRGCRNNCRFCINSLNRERRKYYRELPVEKVIADINSLRGCYQINRIFFMDEVLVYDDDRSREMLRAYKEEIGLPFNCMCRAEELTPELVKMLAAAGCAGIAFGVETADEQLRRDFLQKPIANSTLRDVFALCRESGIKTASFNIVGYPDETEADMRRTLSFSRDELQADLLQIAIMHPFKGTELYDYYRDRNLLAEDAGMVSNFYKETSLALPGISSRRLRIIVCMLYLEFYYPGQILLQKATACLLALTPSGILNFVIKALHKVLLDKFAYKYYAGPASKDKG